MERYELRANGNSPRLTADSDDDHGLQSASQQHDQ